MLSISNLNVSDMSNGGVSAFGQLIQVQSFINRVNIEMSNLFHSYMLSLVGARGLTVTESNNSQLPEIVESASYRLSDLDMKPEEIKAKLDELYLFRNQLRGEERDLIEGLGGYEKIQKAKAHEAGFGPPFSF